jgi:hypothetical protein
MNQNNSNEYLNTQLSWIKQLVSQNGLLYLSNYFADLINDIDLEFTLLIQSEYTLRLNLNDEKINKLLDNKLNKINQNQNLFVEMVKRFEKSCISNQINNGLHQVPFLNDFIITIETKLKLIENIDDNLKYNDLYYEIIKIFDQLSRVIYSQLFMNKTIIFLHKGFNLKPLLIFVDDEFMDEKQIEAFKK